MKRATKAMDLYSRNPNTMFYSFIYVPEDFEENCRKHDQDEAG